MSEELKSYRPQPNTISTAYNNRKNRQANAVALKSERCGSSSRVVVRQQQ